MEMEETVYIPALVEQAEPVAVVDMGDIILPLTSGWLITFNIGH
jgi:hypothetical protein